MTSIKDDLQNLRGGPENQIVESTHTPWLITLADLLSLMLTFFVLLFAMTQVAPDHWQAVVKTMTEQFNPGQVQTAEVEPQTIVAGRNVRARPGLNLGYLQTILDSQTAGVEALEVAQTWRDDGRLIISLPSRLLFVEGSANFSPSSTAALDILARALSSVRNQALVAGHTGLAEPGVGAYQDNWSLSVARALAVAKRLERAGYPGELTATGHAASRFAALDPALPVSDRDGLANRVDIVILPDRRDRTNFELF